MQTGGKVPDDWMYHKSPLDPWVEFLNNWETKHMNEQKKEIVPLNSDCWPNGKKTEDWMADYMGKIIVPPNQKDTWYNVYVNSKTIPNGTELKKIKLKPMTDVEVEKYCADFEVVQEGQESWWKNYPDSYVDSGPRTPAEKGDDIPF